MKDIKVMEVLDSATVKRWHTVDTIGTQDIASHSWGVAVILVRITGGKCSANLLKAAIMHDCAESITGDTPSTAKWKSEELTKSLSELEQAVEWSLGITPSLSALEQSLLKTADILELVHYSIRQIRLGNKCMRRAYENGMRFIESSSTIHWNKEVTELVAILKQEFIHATE